MRIGSLLVMLAAVVTLPVPAAAAEASAAQELRAALRATPDASRGAQLFANCAVCHGADGNGARSGAVPVIAGQHFRVLVKQLVDYRHKRRWDVRMEHFADEHHLTSPQAIADVAKYVSGLPRGWQVGIGTGEYLAHGAKVYFRLCESCHGPVGEGDPQQFVPQLAGQYYEYLLRQLHDAVEGRRPNMGRRHVRLLEDLELADLAGVSDYLSRLVPATARDATIAAAEGRR